MADWTFGFVLVGGLIPTGFVSCAVYSRIMEHREKAAAADVEAAQGPKWYRGFDDYREAARRRRNAFEEVDITPAATDAAATPASASASASKPEAPRSSEDRPWWQKKPPPPCDPDKYFSVEDTSSSSKVDHPRRGRQEERRPAAGPELQDEREADGGARRPEASKKKQRKGAAGDYDRRHRFDLDTNFSTLDDGDDREDGDDSSSFYGDEAC